MRMSETFPMSRTNNSSNHLERGDFHYGLYTRKANASPMCVCVYLCRMGEREESQLRSASVTSASYRCRSHISRKYANYAHLKRYFRPMCSSCDAGSI